MALLFDVVDFQSRSSIGVSIYLQTRNRVTFLLIEWVRKDIYVNEHERLSKITRRQKIK